MSRIDETLVFNALRNVVRLLETAYYLLLDCKSLYLRSNMVEASKKNLVLIKKKSKL